jgi:hypothetical protein
MMKETEKLINQHRDRLMSYLYNELTADEARMFEQHLKDCQVCQKDAEDFRLVRQALASWQFEDIPHIALTVEPQAKRRWFDLLKALPLWTRLVASGAAAMLLLAIFNVQIGYNAADGFRFSASLLPRPESRAPEAVQPQLTREQTVALIEGMIQRAEEHRRQEIAATIEEVTKQLSAENQKVLADLARTLRREQTQRLAEYLDTTDRQYTVPTLAELFSEDARGN